jgi:hypothetical protein
MTEEQEHRDTVRDDDLNRFTRKLDAWGDSLSLGEKALLQVVLERAAGPGLAAAAEETDFSFPATGGFGDVVAPFLRELVSSGALSVRAPGIEPTRAIRGWVEAGDPWVRGAALPPEEAGL